MSLVDHTGQTVTDQSYAGKHLLVFFGYTWCPDICPTELLILGQAIDALGDDGEQVVPLFITIDPERDTPERLREYTTFFHPDFIGVTGERQQIDTLTNALGGVYHIAEHAEGDREYQVDHTSKIWLIDPRGHFHAVFGAPHEPALLAQELSIIAEAYATSGS